MDRSLDAPALIEAIARYMMEGNDRLLSMYSATGSCDTSYEVPNIAPATRSRCWM